MGQDLRDRPETQTSQVSVRTLLARLLDGTIAPCSFARPYVWKPAQMLALLEAVGRGMPVGALVLWEGCTPEWLGARLGPLRLPAPGPWARAVLDGNQRLATLAGALLSETLWDDAVTAADRRRWDICFDADLPPEGRFVHARGASRRPSQIPARALGDTRALLAELGRQESELIDAPAQIRYAFMDRTNRRAARLFEAQIPVITLTTPRVADALECFDGLRSGTPWSARHLPRLPKV